MPVDTLLIILLAALAGAGLPLAAWLRAQRRIRHLEMTLLAQTTDSDRSDELRGLLERVAAQPEQLADNQAHLARRLNDSADQLQRPRVEADRPVTPH